MLNAKFLVPVAILVALLGPTRTWAQRITGAPTLAPPTPAPSQPDIPANQMYGGSLIGVGDILDIRVNDEDDVSGHYQLTKRRRLNCHYFEAARRCRRDDLRSFEKHIQRTCRANRFARSFRDGVYCSGDGTKRYGSWPCSSPGNGHSGAADDVD